MIDFKREAENIKHELVSLRREFHSYPELGFEEIRTGEKIRKFLESEGIEYFSSAQTGICAIIKGNGSKTLALRADIDALPLEDKKECSYSSKVKGKMHACGHDAHTTILMGAAKILNKHKGQLKGNVKLIFEPAEETTGGSHLMIKDGVLENPHVDAVIGLHVQEWLECGKIGVKRGVVYAASNPFEITIKGKGAHGASPNASVDPIVISSYVIQALQTLVSREISPTDPAVITVGTIHGGTAQNIIPDEVKLSGIIRTMKNEHREYIKERLVQLVEGIVKSMRGACSIKIMESYPCLYNDDNMVEVLRKSASEILKEENVIEIESPTMGVESFAYFASERPSVFYYLGSGNKERGIVHPAHNSLFDIDEDCLTIGVSIQCNAVCNYLND